MTVDQLTALSIGLCILVPPLVAWAWLHFDRQLHRSVDDCERLQREHAEAARLHDEAMAVHLPPLPARSTHRRRTV